MISFIVILQYNNMGLTRTDIFTDKQNKIARIAKALAHPARIAILQQLIKEKTCICGQLVIEIGLAQATISQHLRELKEAGLIKGVIDGPKVCYCLDITSLKEIKAIFSEFTSEAIASITDCC